MQAGTPGYRAPEAAKDDGQLPHDCCVDIFSFGVVLLKIMCRLESARLPTASIKFLEQNAKEAWGVEQGTEDWERIGTLIKLGRSAMVATPSKRLEAMGMSASTPVRQRLKWFTSQVRSLIK